jgi:hypothetical protein
VRFVMDKLIPGQVSLWAVQFTRQYRSTSGPYSLFNSSTMAVFA